MKTQTPQRKPFIVNGVVIHPNITIERVIDGVDRQLNTLDNPGFCIACGADDEYSDPDTRMGLCEVCGEKAVYGAAELLQYLD